jgi:hypothetical protein
VLSGSRFGIELSRVVCFADVERRVDEDLDEWQFGILLDPTRVVAANGLGSIRGAEAEITVQAVAQVVTVEGVRSHLAFHESPRP